MPLSRWILLLMSLFVGNLYSQTSYGVYLGGIGSNVSGDLGIGEERNFLGGTMAGFSIQTPLSPKVNFQPELQFSTRGTRQILKEFENRGVLEMNRTREEKLKAYYLSAPLLLSFQLGEKLDLLIGPEISLLTGVENKSELTEVFTDSTGAIDHIDAFRIDEQFRSDMASFGGSGIIGLEYDIQAKLVLGLRSFIGLNDLFIDKGTASSLDLAYGFAGYLSIQF